MTAITRSAIKRKTEVLAASDRNNEPKRLFQQYHDATSDDHVTADIIIAHKNDLFPSTTQLVSFASRALCWFIATVITYIHRTGHCPSFYFFAFLYYIQKQF